MAIVTCTMCDGSPVFENGEICSVCDGACVVNTFEVNTVNCSVFEPCYRPDCSHCNPPGSLPSNMRFARNALKHIYTAKRRAYTGLEPYEGFPRDPACK